MKTKFKTDLNLDDETEVNEFLKSHGMRRRRNIAKELGFEGEGSFEAAQSLKNYAWNKVTAISERKKGNISRAEVFEDICDRIYKEDIEPNIECW